MPTQLTSPDSPEPQDEPTTDLLPPGATGVPAALRDPRRASRPKPASSEHPIPVNLFGRYQIIRELGRGAMSRVFLAHDPALDLQVAIKLLLDPWGKDPKVADQLTREVLWGITLTHPNIVRTFHFERDQTHVAIVMEYVDGETLSARCRRQPGGCFDTDQLLPWIGEACAAIDHAHLQAGVIHRDIKPNNLMLTASGRLKILDFGLSFSVEGSDWGGGSSTAHIFGGTVIVMSPQQLQGEKPTRLDDIYSLGATIYYLLTGAPVFYQGERHIVEQALHDVPSPLAVRRTERGIIGKAPIPSAWEQTVAACLSKNPAHRPQSAGEVITRLRSVPPNSIFLCYRRADTGHICGRIYDRLVAAFGRHAVFRDVDTIPLGEDFREHIRNTLASIQVGLVVIGEQWLTVTDRSGRARLHRSTDHVRIEVETMLARSEVKTVPLFAGHENGIDSDLLPDSLQPLAYRNGLPVRPDPDFHHDIERLIAYLRKLLSTVSTG